MKYATLTTGGEPTIAVIDSSARKFWTLAEAFPEFKQQPAKDMVSAIARLHEDPRKSEGFEGGQSLAQAQVLAPISKPPRNIFCVGKNYRAHAMEFSGSGFDADAKNSQAVPDAPIIFTKPWTAISGPTDDIPLWPELDKAVDYEGELAVVIGRAGRHISKAQAMKHVFGFTILNDVTARDLQKTHKQWYLGKAVDGFAPMGPWIVTPDELAADNLTITTTVNGEVRQNASTADLIFDIPTLISAISVGTRLLPGDIIATGTPEGVGIGFSPPKFLKEGDVVEVTVSGLGKIRNVVRRAVFDR